MLQMCFAVYDKQAMAFGRPFFFPTRGMAIRTFMDEVNRPDENSLIYKHPADFALFYIGEFNDSDGYFTPSKNPEPVAQAIDFRNDVN